MAASPPEAMAASPPESTPLGGLVPPPEDEPHATAERAAKREETIKELRCISAVCQVEPRLDRTIRDATYRPTLTQPGNPGGGGKRYEVTGRVATGLAATRAQGLDRCASAQEGVGVLQAAVSIERA